MLNDAMLVGGFSIIVSVIIPILVERMRRASARQQSFHSRRSNVYIDLVRVCERLRSNATTWASTPFAKLQECEDSELDRVFSEIRIVASARVLSAADRFCSAVHKFNIALFLSARPALAEAHREGHADTPHAIDARILLADCATKVGQVYDELKAEIRREVR